jgi:hypothetical protein
MQMNNIDSAIKNELIVCYQKQFGNKWSANLHKQLVPSPYRFLSVVYSVPIDYIYAMYNQLIQQFRGQTSISVSY